MLLLSYFLIYFKCSISHMDNIMVRAPPRRYFMGPTKSILVVFAHEIARVEIRGQGRAQVRPRHLRHRGAPSRRSAALERESFD